MAIRVSKLQPLWKRYEIAVVKHHAFVRSGASNEIAWHWSRVPKQHLEKFGGTQDYGLDGLAWDPVQNTYVGLQAKCNLQRALSARHLGTFFHAVMRMRRVDVLNRGAVYYAGKLTPNLEGDVDMLSQFYCIDFVHVPVTIVDGLLPHS